MKMLLEENKTLTQIVYDARIISNSMFRFLVSLKRSCPQKTMCEY